MRWGCDPLVTAGIQASGDHRGHGEARVRGRIGPGRRTPDNTCAPAVSVPRVGSWDFRPIDLGPWSAIRLSRMARPPEPTTDRFALPHCRASLGNSPAHDALTTSVAVTAATAEAGDAGRAQAGQTESSVQAKLTAPAPLGRLHGAPADGTRGQTSGHSDRRAVAPEGAYHGALGSACRSGPRDLPLRATCRS